MSTSAAARELRFKLRDQRERAAERREVASAGLLRGEAASEPLEVEDLVQRLADLGAERVVVDQRLDSV